MKKYAIADINGSQYKLVEGEKLFVDKLKEGKIDMKVLLVSDGKKVSVGQPHVGGSKIKLKVLEEEVKGKKIHVRKYKSKSRYRKKIGFRPKYSQIAVEKVA